MAHDLVRRCDSLLGANEEEFLVHSARRESEYRDNYEGYRALRRYLWDKGFDTRFFSLGYAKQADETKLTWVGTSTNTFFFDIHKIVQFGQSSPMDTVIGIMRFVFSDEPTSEVFETHLVLNYDVSTETDNRTILHPLTKGYQAIRKFMTAHQWRQIPHPITQYKKSFKKVGDFLREFTPFLDNVLLAQCGITLPSTTAAPH